MRIPVPEPGERWAQMPGHPWHSISTHGRAWDSRAGRLLTPTIGRAGYPEILGRHLHLFVVEAFLGPRPAGMDTRHIDGNKRNSALSNLVYGTRSENTLDQVRHGTHRNSKKTHCPRGHRYDSSSWTIRGDRECKACRRVREAARRARISAAARVAA